MASIASKMRPVVRTWSASQPLTAQSICLRRRLQPLVARRAQTTTVTPPPPPPPPPPQPAAAPAASRKPKRRFLRVATFFGLTAALGYGLANGTIIINTSPALPSSYSEQIEQQLQSHPLVQQLRADPKFSLEMRPHQRIPPPLRTNSFTAGPDMISPHKVPVPPLVFADAHGTELVSIVYLGRALCGHPGVVHGGMLATMLDEGLARTCFAALPNKVGMTAFLHVNYRAPCRAEQWVVLRGKTTKVEGRKAWVEGSIAALNADGTPGQVFVEGNALFVEPKNAKVAGALMRLVS